MPKQFGRRELREGFALLIKKHKEFLNEELLVLLGNNKFFEPLFSSLCHLRQDQL